MKATLSAVLAVLSLLLGLLFAETLVRVFFPVYDPAGSVDFIRDPDGVPLAPPGFVGRQWKNTGDYDVPVSINRHGLRDTKDLAGAKPEDLFVVGDSFTFGHGVREAARFSNRLQTLLGASVYNLGIPTDIDGYERLLDYARERGAPVRRLLIAICMENDLRYYHAAPVATAARGWRLAALKAYLTRHSALYNLATTAVHRTPPLRDLAIRLGLLRPNLAGLPGPARETAVRASVTRLLALLENQPLDAASVVLIPSRGLWTGPERAAHAAAHRQFREALMARGVPVIDLRLAFETGGEPLALHFAGDGHWNPEGHRRAAMAIHAQLSGAARLNGARH